MHTRWFDAQINQKILKKFHNENKFNGSTYVSQRFVLLGSTQKVERLNYCIYVSKQKIIGTIKIKDLSDVNYTHITYKS